MRPYLAGAIGGLIGGMVVSAAMSSGRRAGLLHEYRGEEAGNWMKRVADTRIGNAGTTPAEQLGLLAASAVFGAGYGASLPSLPDRPLGNGALFGAGLYASAIGGLAPLLGITRGEHREPPAVIAERLGFHVLFGVVTACATDAVLKWVRRRKSDEALPESFRRLGAL